MNQRTLYINKQHKSILSKVFTTAFFLFFIAMGALAQPIITSVNPNSGPVGTIVTITGSNFNADPADNIVFFGATRASVQSATATSLSVVVPTGATYQPLTVVNTATNLIGSSPFPFAATFNGGIGQPITPTFFSPKVDFTTGANPASLVAVADIDGDGKPDLIVVDRTTNTFSILRNKSTAGAITTASFAAKVDFATDSTPSSVAVGDLDGDGKPDIVITSLYPNKISIYRNTSTVGSINTASFATQVDFIADTVSMPTSVAIGDLDGDGKPELAITNSFGNTVSILKNTATVGAIDSTSFAAAVDFTTGLGPTYVAIADIDGDGKPDLVVSNFNAGTVSALHNTTVTDSINAKSFAKKVDFTVGTGPHALAIGDLNGDGKPDIVVANQGSNTVSILANQATNGIINSSSFAFQVNLPSNGESPYYVSVGNIDGDSLPDIVVANQIGNNISVFQNTYSSGSITTSSFAAGVNFATNIFPVSAAVADLDGDGKPDIAVPDYGKNTISVFRNIALNTVLVSFSSFTGKYENPGNALLAWKSATETNTAYYSVQRSINGGAFAEVGKVAVHGAGYQYNYTDALPLANSSSVVYYRLQAVDNNGMKTYSSIVSININKNSSLTIYPNPAKDYINIQAEAGIGNALLLITDMAGHTVLSTKLQNTSLQQIPLGALAKGVYTATIFTVAGKQTKQIVIR